MKKVVISVLAALLVLVLALVGVKTFLFSGEGEGEPSGVPDEPAVEEQISSEEQAPAVDENPIRTYDNGIASFTYDGTKLVFEEMVSDDENGIPLTSFYPINSTSALPRVDIIPLFLEEPFAVDVPQSDWENLAKALILAYYNSTEQEKVVVELTDTVVKVEGTGSKMFVHFTSTLEGFPEYSMSGSIRLVSNESTAIVTLAMCQKGSSLPEEMRELYMSTELH